MVEQTKRKIWQQPWGYSESIAIVAGVALIGLILQISIGSFDFFLLTNPANYIAGLVLFLLSVILGLCWSRSGFARWISSGAMSVTLIMAILLLTIIMGLTPQVAAGADSRMLLGFDAMTCNWSFVLLYGLLLLSLGVTITVRTQRFRLRRDIPFMLQHVGLYLFLMASGLGYADMERYIMYVEEGETQWRVYNAEGEVQELPIAITLHDFDMEVYPPRLVVVDRATGEAQPADKPQYYQIDPDLTHATIAGWQIEQREYIHEAVRGADSTYRAVPMAGATPAIHITASREGEQHEGWVCGGNRLQPYMALTLSDEYSVVMTPADPRRYLSDVEVFTQAGDAVEARIEVNKPLRVGDWTIYQYGYDNASGDLSSYSSFELVYDPWLTPVYAAIVLIMLGMISMIVTGRKRAKRSL